MDSSIAASPEGAGQPRSSAAYVTQRSKAIPKNSLFGTVLERLSDDELKNAMAIDAAAHERDELARRVALKQTYDKTAPPRLLAGVGFTEKMAELEKHRADILRNETTLREQEKAMQRVDEMARYFRLPPAELLRQQEQQEPEHYQLQPPLRRRRQQQQQSHSLTLASPHLNLELAREMNRLGVSEGTNSYNRDRYQSRPPVHSYSLLGPPLGELGMEFAHAPSETAEQYAAPRPAAVSTSVPRRSGSSEAAVETAGGVPRYARGEALARAIERPGSAAPGGDEAPLPAADPKRFPSNIRRSFGSRRFDELFADEAATLAAVERLRGGESRRRPGIVGGRRRGNGASLLGAAAETPPATNYNDLSYVMRTDTFPGHSFYRPSLAKESFTKDVFERRYMDPEEFRHTRDAYGTWAEQNIIREQMKKLWDAPKNGAPTSS